MIYCIKASLQEERLWQQQRQKTEVKRMIWSI